LATKGLFTSKKAATVEQVDESSESNIIVSRTTWLLLTHVGAVVFITEGMIMLLLLLLLLSDCEMEMMRLPQVGLVTNAEAVLYEQCATSANEIDCVPRKSVFSESE
jgi:hypothetical protein